MSILVELKKDHKKIKALCKRIKADAKLAPKRRLKTFLELADLVARHSFAEEETLYTRLKPEGDKAKALALEGYEEHHVADFLIGELKHLAVDDDHWTAKFDVLKEPLEHHIEEEEACTFAQARATFDAPELKEAGREFLELRKLDDGRAHKEGWSGTYQPAAAHGLA